MPRQTYSKRRCDIAEILALKRTNRTSLSAICIGDVLKVVYRPGPPPIVIVLTKHGSAAGEIGYPSATRLIDCIQRRYEYVATVLRVRSSYCKVQLQLKQK
jgi:hypothetical protein